MNTTKEKLKLVYGDVNFGVSGDGFEYLFSYQAGGPVSFVAGQREWLYRAPKPTFWRATTDNDRGSGFNIEASQWYAADQFIKCRAMKVIIDNQSQALPIGAANNHFTGNEMATKVTISYTYETVTVPATQVNVDYTITADGKIAVNVAYQGQTDLPSLPVFGMRFVMPTKASHYRYQGLSGETYPDRQRGGKYGIYDIAGLPMTPYLVPQDCGMHMDTEWVEVYRDTVLDQRNQLMAPSMMRITASGQKFAFACLPYTAQEIENATHMEELPIPRRTVLTVLGAVRGVGGIDSWGSDVLPAYHIDSQRSMRYQFEITLPSV